MIFAPRPPKLSSVPLAEVDQTVPVRSNFTENSMSRPPQMPPVATETPVVPPVETVEPTSEVEATSQMLSDAVQQVEMDDDYFMPEQEESQMLTSSVQEIDMTSEELPKIDDIWFSDIYFTPERIAYVRDEKTSFGLKVFDAEDLKDFHKALEESYQGSSSYSITYGNSTYRVERVKSLTGIHYTARRMPRTIPDIHDLGLPQMLVNQLKSLNKATGLILIGGPTGMGKTTTATALLKYFLENEGGFAYTIEDPPEMPLDGIYKTNKGSLGVCKQTEVLNNNWELGLRSALRSRPRYILVGEIRTAETASEMLRAATSGHLVISTIHANNLEDALNSVIKYAAASGMEEGLASDLLARGILGVLHQKLVGTSKLMPTLHYCFANPDPMEADQMRMIIRDGKINLSTLMEAQMAKMIQGRPLFKSQERK